MTLVIYQPATPATVAELLKALEIRVTPVFGALAVKIDLDELERDAKLDASVTPWDTTANRTLALIARIRELEDLARQAIRDHVRNIDETEMHAILENGVVIP